MKSRTKQFLFWYLIFIVTVFCHGQKSTTEMNDSVDSLIKLAGVIKYSNLDSSIVISDMAMELAMKHDYEIGYAYALVSKASSLGIKAAYVESMALYNEAMVLFIKHIDLKGLQKCYSGTGLVYAGIADYPKAIDAMMSAVKIAEALNDTTSIAVLLNNIASVYIYQKDFDNALEKLNRIVALEESIGDKSVVPMAYANIGIVNSVKGNYEKAKEYYKQSMEAGKRVENNHVVQFSVVNLAHLNVHLGELDEALANYHFALEIQKVLGLINPMTATLKGLGDVHFQKKSYSTAEDYYLQSLLLSEKHGILSNLNEVYFALANLYEVWGKTEESLYYTKKHYALKEDLSELNMKKETELIEARYLLEKMGIEVELLNYQSQIKEQKISQQRNQIRLLAAGAFVFIVMFVLILLQKRRKDKAYEMLVVKNLEQIKSEGKAFQRQIIAPETITDRVEREDEPDIEGDDFQNSKKYEKSSLTADQKIELLDKILYLVETEKLYLNSDLSLDVLRNRLGVYKNYISQVINELVGKNFMSFVNEYRVKEAQLMLVGEEFKNLTIEGIAQMCGFQSKASFNAAFKKFTGVTPSRFKEISQKSIIR
jgi:AraC-like DNA-binding protein